MHDNIDSIVSQMVSNLSNQARYPLTLESLFWNKYNKLRVKSWGGCVTDQTVLINNTRMPIIRKPNYSDSTWDVSLDSIPITIGNQTGADQYSQPQTVSLRQYLTNFSEYISSSGKGISDTKTDDDSKELPSKSTANLLASSDTTVIMNTSCTLLPGNISTGNIEFSLGTFNWKTSLKNPACLYIISTYSGTSSVIVEGNFQKIFYNNHGKKSLFSLPTQAGLDKNECITIVQVPLKQKSRKQIEQEQASSSGWGLTSWWSSGSEGPKRVFDVLPTNCKDDKVQSLLKEYGYHEQCEEDSNSAKVKISRYYDHILSPYKFPEFSYHIIAILMHLLHWPWHWK